MSLLKYDLENCQVELELLYRSLMVRLPTNAKLVHGQRGLATDPEPTLHPTKHQATLPVTKPTLNPPTTFFSRWRLLLDSESILT